ncbi:MAG: hypothetical protein OEY58_22315 [Gammaproteobacteria bacterium]|nr:hypothetical protein [Gammaproteobacteria bacterium]
MPQTIEIPAAIIEPTSEKNSRMGVAVWMNCVIHAMHAPPIIPTQSMTAF